MSTVRRIYLYAVSFVSLMVITWGLIGLVRSAFTGDNIGDDVAQLAGALALILVGIPVFLLHWWLAQRSANTSDEERTAYVRALFIYAALLATLIPVTQNLMALVNRILFSIFDLTSDRGMFGMDQTWSDNLIAIIMNILIAGYFFYVLRKDWAYLEAADESSKQAMMEIRRLYRYIWMIYGLGLMVIGLQQSILFLADWLEDPTSDSLAILANGITLMLTGVPIWTFLWRLIQKSLSMPEEANSLFRAIVLHTVSFISMVLALLASGMLLTTLLLLLLGEEMLFREVWGEIRDPLSIAVPFGITWFYFNWVRRQGREQPELESTLHTSVQHTSVQHIYTYLGAFLGLITFFIGLQKLAFFLIHYIQEPARWATVHRENLAVGLAMLVIGLPFWVINWRRANQHAQEESETGDQVRRSLIRKIYLYLVLFIAVIGVMASAGVLIFHLLQAALGDPESNLGQIVLELLSLLILFGLVLWYHGMALRADSQHAADSLAAKHAEFPVIVLASELGAFSEAVLSALQRETPALPVAIHVVDQGPPDEDLSSAKAVVLPAIIAAHPSEAIRLWLQNFSGYRLVIPTPARGWLWISANGSPLKKLAGEAAEMIRKLAEGEAVNRKAVTAWTVLGYLFAGIVGLIFLLVTLMIILNVFM